MGQDPGRIEYYSRTQGQRLIFVRTMKTLSVALWKGKVHLPGHAKEDRLPMLKWLNPGSKWRVAVLMLAGVDVSGFKRVSMVEGRRD